MDTPPNSAEVVRLYREFSDSFRAKDDEAVRQIYRQLLRLGRPRAEIVDEAFRFGVPNCADLDRSRACEQGAAAKPIEPIVRVDRIAATDAVDSGSGANLGPVLILDPNSDGNGVVEPGAAFRSSTQERGAGNEATDTAVSRHILRPASMLRSSIGLCTALSVIAVSSITIMALLPARTTAENAITPEGSARSAAATSWQSPGRNEGPSTVVQAAGASGASVGYPDQIRREAPPKDVEARKGRISLTSTSTTALGVAEITARDPAQIAPRDAGSQQLRSFSPPTSQPANSAQLPNAVAGQEQPSSRGLVAAHAAPAVAPTVSPASSDGSTLPNSGSAMLLTRGDSLFGAGDVVSARLFYERAADAGDGRAALRLGETYDPHFLIQTHLRGVHGDVGAAGFWYKRARDLGMTEAELLLGSLHSK